MSECEMLTRAVRAYRSYLRGLWGQEGTYGAAATCKDLEVCHYCKESDLYHAVKSLTNVSQSRLLVSHTAGQSTQAGHYRWDVAG